MMTEMRLVVTICWTIPKRWAGNQ